MQVCLQARMVCVLSAGHYSSERRLGAGLPPGFVANRPLCQRLRLHATTPSHLLAEVRICGRAD